MMRKIINGWHIERRSYPIASCGDYWRVSKNGKWYDVHSVEEVMQIVEGATQ